MKPELSEKSSKNFVDHSYFNYLIKCPIGQKFRVKCVNAGHHAKRRLACLGIIPGVDIIKKKAAPFRGPVEITVKGSSLVIGRGLASKIIVTPF